MAPAVRAAQASRRLLTARTDQTMLKRHRWIDRVASRLAIDRDEPAAES